MLIDFGLGVDDGGGASVNADGAGGGIIAGTEANAGGGINTGPP